MTRPVLLGIVRWRWPPTDLPREKNSSCLLRVEEGGGGSDPSCRWKELRHRLPSPSLPIVILLLLLLPQQPYQLRQKLLGLSGAMAAAGYTLDDFLTAYRNPNVSYHEVMDDIVLNSSLPPLNRVLTLVGVGPGENGQPIIDGRWMYRGIVTNSNITLINLKFRRFRSNTDGAVLFSTGDTVFIERCVFRDNRALNGTNGGVSGGALHFYDVIFFINQTLFVGNRAEVNGGAIHSWSAGGGGNISNCVFLENQADQNGGAAHFRDQLGITFYKCRFKRNKAEGQGGALFFSHGINLIADCDFTGNTAKGVGGAVRFFGGDEAALHVCGGNTYTGNNAQPVGSSNMFIRALGGNASVPSVYFCGRRPPGTYIDSLPGAVIRSCLYC